MGRIYCFSSKKSEKYNIDIMVKFMLNFGEYHAPPCDQISMAIMFGSRCGGFYSGAPT